MQELHAQQLAAAKQKRIDRMFATAGVPKKFQGLTVQTLMAQLINDQEKRGKRDAIRAALELIAKGTVQGKKGLMVWGGYGVGKTGLLTSVLVEYLNRGRSGLWIEFYDFTDSVQAAYSRNVEESSTDLIEAAQKVDWIFLDDVGNPNRVGPETDDRSKILYRLINGRHNADLPMLISSNLNPTQFSQQFGVRTFERILDSCHIVKMEGKNLRHE